MDKVKTLLRYVMALFYIGSGINHFLSPDFYVDIMPPYLPWHLALVYLSGLVEIVLGAFVLVRRLLRWAAWGIVLMLVAFLPVHVHMLVNSQLYPQLPVWGLWLRFPIQGLFILWAWWYTLPPHRQEA